MLTIEAKKLHSVEKAQGIISDFKRALTLNYQHDHNHLPHYVLLLAVTEQTSNANWWCASENWDNITPTWKELAEILQRDGVITSSLPMHDAHGKTHHLLYTISKVR